MGAPSARGIIVPSHHPGRGKAIVELLLHALRSEPKIPDASAVALRALLRDGLTRVAAVTHHLRTGAVIGQRQGTAPTGEHVAAIATEHKGG